MAVADAAPALPSSRRPSWGHMLGRGMVAFLVVWAGILVVALLLIVLPGHLNQVFGRIVNTDREQAFTGGSAVDVAANAIVALLGAVVYAFAFWSQLRSRDNEVASGFWILLAALVGAAVAFFGDGTHTFLAFLVTLVAARYLAFDRDGRPVPPPLRLRLPGVALAAALLALCAIVVAAAASHPLEPDLGFSPAVSLHREAGEPVLTVAVSNDGPVAVRVKAASGRGVARLREARRLTPGEQAELALRPDCARLHPGEPLPVTLTFAGGHRQRLTVPAVSHGCR